VIAAAAVGGILLASVTLYAVLGGADFGGGLWDLLAGGDPRGRAPRRLIDETITPVWEANHVWLIFALVIFWTAFPDAFAAVMTTVALPLWLALLGIVLRGAGFAFRKEASSPGLQRGFGATFAFSSLLTPFFMGTVIGAVATGQVRANASQASVAAWTNATSLLTGFMFVGACGYLAAVYLSGEAARGGDAVLKSYFARRAQAAGIVTGALSLAALAELHSSNTLLFSRLTGRALPLVIVAGLSGVAVVMLLAAARPTGVLAAARPTGVLGAGRRTGVRVTAAVRVIAALGVAAVVWGWGVAQYPVLLPGTGVTLSNAGAPHATMVALVGLFIVVAGVIGPSFALLFSLQGRRLLHAGDAGALPAVAVPGTQPLAGAPRQQPARPHPPRPGTRNKVLGLVAVAALVRAALRRRRAR
jgi:cytochrome bd ubiquinol oxidase subunit II